MKLLRRLISVFLMLLLLSLPESTHAREVWTGIYGMVGTYSDDVFMNIVSANGFKIIQTTPDKTILDKAQNKNLKCLVMFQLDKNIALDDAKWQVWVTNIKTKVSLLKNNPAVFAWYLVDEPDGQNIPVSRIKEIC